MATTELQVRIESEGGALTLTPEALLLYYLPGAKLMPGREDIYEGTISSTQGTATVYIHRAALVGALMDCREKHLNPVSQIYMIPSSSPNKRSGHKIKYQVGLERARKIPGFLGINSGLLVRRGTEVCETHGAMSLEGDVILGAWAEAYVAGLHRPIRHDVDAREFTGISAQWKSKGKFMLVKVALDQLCYLKLAPMYADQQPATDRALPTEEHEIMLDANEIPASTQPLPAESTSTTEQPLEAPFLPDTLYVGTLKEIWPRNEKKAGGVVLETDQGDLRVYFWSRPDTLKEYQDWNSLIGTSCGLTFTERTDKQGKTWRYLAELDVTEAQQPEEKEAAA